jgi:hypothetical protein
MAVEVSNKIFNYNATEPSPYEIAENVEVEVEENFELEITITAASTSEDELRLML